MIILHGTVCTIISHNHNGLISWFKDNRRFTADHLLRLPEQKNHFKTLKDAASSLHTYQPLQYLCLRPHTELSQSESALPL